MAEEKENKKVEDKKEIKPNKAPLFLGVGALVVIILAAGGWFFTNRGKVAPAPLTGEEEVMMVEEKGEEGESFTGKIKDLVVKGLPMKCTFEDGQGNKSVGFIKGEKYYAEVTAGEKTSHLIIKGDCLWSWDAKENEGLKMCFEPEEGEESAIWDSDNAPQDDLHCVPAAVSDDKFDPPAGVKFLDFDQMPQNLRQ